MRGRQFCLKQLKAIVLECCADHVVEKAVMGTMVSRVDPEKQLTYADVAKNPGIRMDIDVGRMAPLPVPGAPNKKKSYHADSSWLPLQTRPVKKTIAVIVKSIDPEVDVLENVKQNF